MSGKTPSIGRVVHFVYGEKHLAAIITDPGFYMNQDGAPEGQALTVFPVSEPPFTTVAIYDENALPSTWHWPEYVP